MFLARPGPRSTPLRYGLAFLVTAAILAGAEATASARSAGLAALGCDGCHSGGKPATVALRAEPPNPKVGQPITLTVTVSNDNGPTAGFFLTTLFDAPGAFEAIEAGTTASTTGALHTTPRAGTGGVSTFSVRFTATEPTGVAFDAYGLSANGDRSTRGDGPGVAHLELLIGCTGTTYTIDQDGDGYGSTDPAYPSRKDCKPPPGYAEAGGDCDDFRAEVHPGAPEQCDMKDNDCNGVVDDGVVDQPFCEDKDGDGHGLPTGMMKMDCKPSAGFGDCGGDCDDREPTTHPGATELCDGRDNNCDGKVDEGVRPICGVGLCARYASGCDATARCTPGQPFEESCNGYDDDCDGEVDEGENEELCGDPDVPCIRGECAGVPGTGASAGAGGAGAGGAGAGGAGAGGGGASGSASGSSGTSGMPAAAGSEGEGARGVPTGGVAGAGVGAGGVLVAGTGTSTTTPRRSGCATVGPARGSAPLAWLGALVVLVLHRRRSRRQQLEAPRPQA
jgi:hypothetical protein